MIAIILSVWGNHFDSVIKVIGHCAFSGYWKEADNHLRKMAEERNGES